ncbi:MAG: hypothetical protein H6Q55_1634 [Deltaproteobacteria bacterium]|nr:hypothetical protein [Deltaproteobacteria bacterium]
MKENTELLQFPCPYPLKVLGKNTKEFLAVVSGIIEKHIVEGGHVTYSTRVSSGEKYLSMTATFDAQSQTQLTAIYEELNVHELVLMTL